MFVTGLVAFLTLLLMSPSKANNLVKQYPRVAAADRHDRILIVAPHIDDESIGAGGYALDAIAEGAEVYVVFLTAGDCNRFSARILNKTLGPTASNYLTVGRTRIAEAHAAMHLLGVPEDHYFVLGYPDRGLKAILDDRTATVRSRGTWQRSVPYEEAMTPGSPYRFANVMADLEHVIETARPTTVIAPVPFDLHPDHVAAAIFTQLALDDLHLDPHRLGYLVHTSRIPTSLVRSTTRALLPPARMRSYSWATYPLTATLQHRKDALLQTYKSQRPYLSILRNAFVRTNELFFVEPAQQFAMPIAVNQ
jgi:LmbE family N-acetylglucosaminyl deacetylase